MDDTEPFARVLEQVMPLIYRHLQQDAPNAGLFWLAERFVTHDVYQQAHAALVELLSSLRADAATAEFMLTRVLPAHRPPLH